MTANMQNRSPQLLDWAAVLFFAAVLIADRFLPRGDLLWLRLAGVLVLLLSSIFMFLPFVALMRHGHAEPGQSYLHTTVVVNRGIYSVVRHPQYLGYSLLTAGFMLISQHWLIVIFGLAATVCFYLQAVVEERYCRTRFGSAYDRYLQQVPRFNFFLGLLRRLTRAGKVTS
ncbi:MAG: isoprenylcysteine carboxylmethyltransferase family protein [bacterium]